MTDFVYAVVYSPDGSILIAKKYLEGFYFIPNAKNKSGLVPGGIALNGAGKFAFPGGKATADSIRANAEREFSEETHVAIPASAAFHEYPLTPSGPYDRFGAGLFKVSDAELGTLFTRIKTNLPEGYAAQVDVRSRVITAYDQIAARYKNAPADNELSHIGVSNLNKPTVQDWIEKWASDNDLNWFYAFVRDVCEDLGIKWQAQSGESDR